MANTGKYTRTPLERCPILPGDGKALVKSGDKFFFSGRPMVPVFLS